MDLHRIVANLRSSASAFFQTAFLQTFISPEIGSRGT